MTFVKTVESTVTCIDCEASPSAIAIVPENVTVPEANVGRSFLSVATGELSVHENQRIYKVLTDNIQACLSASKTPAQAMADTQTDADRILKPYRRT